MDERRSAISGKVSRSLRLTDRDLQVLWFIAEQKVVTADQVGALLGSHVSAEAVSTRLRSLSAAGMLRRERFFHRQPACYQITRKAIGVTGSDLPVPGIDLRSYHHDLGVCWLWLAAREGTFGQMREVLSERRLRSHDATADGRGDPLGVRLGGVGPAGGERLHYPDLLLGTERGQRIAVELELTGKGRARREKILTGYGIDRRIDAVLYLVGDRAISRSLAESAARVGVSQRVHIQPVRLSESCRPPGGASVQRAHARDMRRSRPTPARAAGSGVGMAPEVGP